MSRSLLLPEAAKYPLGAGAHLSLPPRVAVLDKVTDFLFFLGKLLIVGSVGKYWPT